MTLALLPRIAQPAITLRPHQIEAVNAIRSAWQAGQRRLLLVAPTGIGKTVMAADLIRELSGATLTLVHRDELVSQTLDKFAMAGIDPTEVGVVKAERDETDARHVIASVQTIARPGRRARLHPDFALVWVDEAHHSAAASYLDVLEDMGCFESDGPLLLGTTATPDRLDQLGLGHVFESVAHEIRLRDMIRAGYLADITALRVGLDVDLDAVHRRGGDLVEAELADALEQADAPVHAAAAFAEHGADRKALLFTAGVRLAHHTATALTALGIAAEALDGGMPLEQRRAILRRLHTGQTRVVSNCQVLTEGFDEPSVDAIVLARPTQSRGLFQQMIGRGLRPYPGKTDCLVLDLVGNSSRHSLVSVASLLGLDAREVEECGVLEAERRQEARRQRNTVPDGRLVARPVDLLSRRELVWTPIRDTLVLSLGEDGWVGIEPSSDGTWRVLEHPGREFGVRLRLVQTGLDFGYAMGLAEDLARRSVPSVLLARGSAWRTRPPTEKRRAFFARKGWYLPENDGEAADAQNQYFARLAWSRARRP